MMEEKEIFRKVGEIINELNDQYKYLSQDNDNVNELEIELFVANANFLADHIKIIQKIKGARKPETQPVIRDLTKEPITASVEAGSSEEEKSEEVVAVVAGKGVEKTAVEEGAVAEVQKEEVAVADTSEDDDEALESGKEDTKVEEESPEPVEEQKSPEGEKEESADEIKFDFSQAAETEEAPIETSEPEVAEEPVVQEVVIREKTVRIDVPLQEDHIPTINDLLAGKSDSGVGKYNRAPAGDLKSMINLNDKLLFVKDLFNGYNLAYSEAIELANRFDSFEAADNFLKKNYAAKNSWSDKQATVDKLYEILNRKFSK